jgi:hypothetical protein
VINSLRLGLQEESWLWRMLNEGQPAPVRGWYQLVARFWVFAAAGLESSNNTQYSIVN